MARLYTAFDERIAAALARAVDSGLVSESASRAEQLRALALYGGERLREDAERAEKLEAYRELAADEERSAAIRDSVLSAAADGIL